MNSANRASTPSSPPAPMVCLLAAPRTGSSYVCDLLGNDPEFESHGEIFHRKQVFWSRPHRDRLLNAFADIVRPSPAGINSRELVDFAHRYPKRFLSVIAHQRQAPWLAFKIFPNHLPPRILTRTLLKEPEIRKVILTRDPLESYVSLLKARQVGKWSHCDTSELRVEVPISPFLTWHRRLSNWYQRCRHTMRRCGQTFGELTYSQLKDQNDEENLAMIRQTLESLGATFSASLPQSGRFVRVRPKQDRSAHWIDAIANLEQLKQELQKRRLGHLLPDYPPLPTTGSS